MLVHEWFEEVQSKQLQPFYNDIIAGGPDLLELVALSIAEQVDFHRSRVYHGERMMKHVRTLATQLRHQSTKSQSREAQSPVKPAQNFSKAITDAYRIFNLHPGASLEDVKRARRRLLQEYHPDRFANAPDKAAHSTILI